MPSNPRPRYKNLSGVPLGGIGAGKVELCPDGAFRHLTFHNNLDVPITDIHNPFRPMPSFPIANLDTSPDVLAEGLEGCFMAAWVAGHGAMVLKESEPGLTDTLARDSIDFVGEVPSADLAYPPLGAVDLSCHAFSSLVFNEPDVAANRDSSLPALTVHLKAHNRGTQPTEVAFLFSFVHLLGIGGYPNAAVKDLRGNTLRFEGTDKSFPYLDFNHSTPKLDPRLDGNQTLAVAVANGDEVSHQVWSVDRNHGSKQRFWSQFSRTGTLANGEDGGSFQGGALAVKRTLQPGESWELPFYLGWYFPVRTDSKGRGLRSRNAYANHFTSSLQVVRYFRDNETSLWARTDLWRSRLRDSSLPGWLVTKLINDTFPLYSNSIFDVEGRFSIAESPGFMSGCMGTMDQRAASHGLYAAAFPRLSEAELGLFAHQQIGSNHPQRHGTHWDLATGTFTKPLDRQGAILHDIGWDDLDGGGLGHKFWVSPHWPDLSLVFTLQSYGHLLGTGDEAFGKRLYPQIKLALQFNRRLDQNGDGIADLWGPGSSTFDSEAFPYYGASSYIASLTLAAAKAGEAWARWAGDGAFADELVDWGRQVRQVMETRLFSPALGYYLSWADELAAQSAKGERPHTATSDNSMVAQLAGVWFADFLGLGEILDPAQVTSALAAMQRKNIGLAEFCPAQEVSADDKTVSFSWPYYAESYLIAPLCSVGRSQQALDALEGLHQAITVRDGSPWSSPLVWKGPGNGDREWGSWYMSNTASWSILAALTGFAWNALTGTLRIDPRLPESGVLDNVPVFAPRFRLLVSATADTLTVVVDEVFDAEGFEVREFQGPWEGMLTVGGKAVTGFPVVLHTGDEVNYVKSTR